MRLAAEDLLDYCTNPDYVAKKWPAGYWSKNSSPDSTETWENGKAGLLAATERMAQIIEDPDTDLYGMLPAADRDHHHTLRAALILLDHNSYHIGQLIALRKALGVWQS